MTRLLPTLEVYSDKAGQISEGQTIEQLIQQQRDLKIKSGRSLVMYLALLASQASLAASLLLLLLVAGADRRSSMLWTAFIALLADIGVKVGYFYYWYKKIPSNFQKRKQRLILEILAITKNVLVSLFIVDNDDLDNTGEFRFRRQTSGSLPLNHKYGRAGLFCGNYIFPDILRTLFRIPGSIA